MNTPSRSVALRSPGGRWFSPLLLCTAVACAVTVGRVALSDTGNYLFLLWNLLLAWLPYLLSMCAAALYQQAPRGRVALTAAGVAWLLFFPNAPYIVTDFVHLRHHSGFAWWYDVGMVAIFAWTGCFLGVASLDVMHALVRQAAGRAAGWLFVLASAVLGGLGVYMGRFQRWNSWDLLLDPLTVLASLAGSLLDPGAARQALGVTALFAALLVVCYVTFVSSARR
jgi:uncharacterized membrane protein